MTEKNKTNGSTRKNGNGASDDSSADPKAGRQTRNSDGQAFGGRADQLGTIVSKGLDLAEAGLSLGLSMINQFGAVAQHTILERMAAEATRDASPGRPAPEPQDTGDAWQGPVAADEGPAPSEEQQYWLTNRLPLSPGAPVKVSFSINNDSMVTPKKVNVRVEGFVGESEGQRIDPDGFAVKPGRKTIAPMDFEKFVLQGAVPPETAPDVYQGIIIVQSDEEMRIPVRLTVMLP